MIAVLMRINWHTIGSILARVMPERDREDGDRLDAITRIGIDEVSFAKGQRYLTIVVDCDTGRLVFVAEGRSKASVAAFFDALGPRRSAAITHVSADGAGWIATVLPERAAHTAVCLDPFHIVQRAGAALDTVRRQVWNDARRAGMRAPAQALKGCRNAL